MNNIPRGTKVITLLNYLQKPNMGLYETHGAQISQADVRCAAIITDSRLDDELSVATVEFAITPLWLQFLSDDPYGLPRKTALGTLWAWVDRNAIDVDGQTAFIKAVKQDEEDLLFAEMLAEFDDTDVNIQDKDGMTALHWSCTIQHPVMVQLCLSVPDCITGLRDKLGRTAFDIAGSNNTVAIPDLFYRNIMEIEADSPQSALLRLLTITSERKKDVPIFPGMALFEPVEAGDEQLVLALIDRGINLTTRNANGDSALDIAAGKSNAAIGRAILNAGSDVNSRGNGGVTPLHYAALTGNAEMVDAILASGADITIEDDDGNLAVHLAEQKNHIGIAHVLNTHRTVLMPKRVADSEVVEQAEGGAGPAEINLVDGGPALREAPGLPRRVEDGRTGFLYGDINIQDRVLKELLQVAIAEGDDGVWALKLLAASLSPSDDISSGIVLRQAVECGNVEMCQLLLAAGANINKPDAMGESVLGVAVDTGDIAMVKLLLSSGANIDETGIGGTALYRAARCEFTRIIPGGSIDKSTTTARELGIEMVKILLAAGAKPNVADQRDGTALHAAAENGVLEIVVLLLENGGFTEVLDYNHYTPLHYAASNGNASVVSHLLLHGAQIEVRTRIVSEYGVVGQARRRRAEKIWPKRAPASGDTALHLAVSAGKAEIVRVLLENGAVFNSRSLGGTPRERAEGGNPDIIAMLDIAQRNHEEGTGS